MTTYCESMCDLQGSTLVLQQIQEPDEFERGILPQIVHCLFSVSIDSIVSGVLGVLCLVPGQSSASPHSALGRQRL